MSFSLYIHLPFCVQKCDYCDFFSKPHEGNVPDSYLDAVAKEANLYARVFEVDCWDTVYLGGGTPSLLTSEQITGLLSKLSMHISEKTKEITIEMNPESVTEEKILTAQMTGFTRLSLGIQSLNDKALKAVNRHCTSEKAKEALAIIKKCWRGQLNLDVIAGLPEQTDEEFISSLKQIIAYEPDHISMYTLTVEDGTPLYNKIKDGISGFDQDKADEQWLKGRRLLEENGYVQYEVSNFAKPGKESLHNMTYWTQGNYAGVGAGATGSFYGRTSVRWTNTTDIEEYIAFWSKFKGSFEQSSPKKTEMLDIKTREYEFLMMGFRTLRGINSEEYKKRFANVAPWNGNLALRLGTEDGIWHRFAEEKLTSEKTEADGSTTYALNSQGILLLNKFLVELM